MLCPYHGRCVRYTHPVLHFELSTITAEPFFYAVNCLEFLQNCSSLPGWAPVISLDGWQKPVLFLSFFPLPVGTLTNHLQAQAFLHTSFACCPCFDAICFVVSLVSLCRPKVKDYEPVFDLRGQSDMELAKELTGRKYTPIKYWLDTTPDSKSRAFDVSVKASCQVMHISCRH